MCTRGVMFSAGGLPDCLWFMGWKCKPPALDPEEHSLQGKPSNDGR